MASQRSSVTLHAGVPSINKTVFRRVGVAAHDPAAFIEFSPTERVVIVRDVERSRAQARANGSSVHVYEDFEPSGGLSGDREIRAAQAIAECLRRHGVGEIVADRSLSLLVAETVRDAGIGVRLDAQLGVADRRHKTREERAALREAQRITEGAIRFACEMIAGADTDDSGALVDAGTGEPLTSERVKARVIGFLAERGAVTDDLIVAGGPTGADCHHTGAGVLRSGEPVVVDIFPCHVATGYHGDCTRGVVHGEVSAVFAAMHAAVVEAKSAAIDALAVGVTGEAVHLAAVRVLERHGYHMGWAPADADETYTSMPHGTGHGIGLDLKEPPLLDMKGPALVDGDCVTVEPALYRADTGGIRIEDMLIVASDGVENFNTLHEGLDWRA